MTQQANRGRNVRYFVSFYGSFALIVYLSVLTFARFLRGGEGTADLSLAQVGFVLLFVLIFFSWIATGLQTPFQVPSWTVWIIAFLAYSALTVVYVAYHGLDFVPWIRQWYEFVVLLLVIILSPQIAQQSQVYRLLGAVIATSSIISIQGIVINIQNYAAGPYPFVFGLTGLPSTMYIWGTIVSFALLIRAVYQRSTRVTVVLLLITFIHVVRLFIDLRRLPILTVGVGVLTILVVNRKEVSVILERNLKLVAAVTVMCTAILAWPTILLSNRLIQRNLLRGLLFRFEASRQALIGLKENPLIGRGYIPQFNPGYEIVVQGGVKSVATVHNLYIYVIANAGLIGFVLFMMILFSVLRLSIQTLYKDIEGLDRTLFSAAFGVFLSMLLFFLLAVRSYQTDTMVTFAIVASIITYYRTATYR